MGTGGSVVSRLLAWRAVSELLGLDRALDLVGSGYFVGGRPGAVWILLQGGVEILVGVGGRGVFHVLHVVVGPAVCGAAMGADVEEEGDGGGDAVVIVQRSVGMGSCRCVGREGGRYL